MEWQVTKAGEAIKIILDLEEENRKLKRDLELVIASRNEAYEIVDFYSSEQFKEHRRAKHESQDYSILAGVILIVWLGFIGFVING